jgi:Ca2+-transporting ATPase
MIHNPFMLSAQEIADHFDSDTENGLDKKVVKKHLEEYGSNQMLGEGPKSQWRILLDQLLDPIIYILAAASVMAFLFSDWLEGVAILIVILISVIIGFFMELKAIRSLETLRKMGQTITLVIRSGITQKVKASELVPGDVVIIQRGDIVTADARLISVENLSIKESALTGESIPI